MILKKIVLLLAALGAHLPVLAAPPAAVTKRPTAYGINLSSVAYWNADRSFMNLAAGGAWRSILNGWSEVADDRIDPDGTIASLKPGESLALALVRPPRARHGDIAIRCRFEGQGKVDGVGMVAPKLSAPGRLDFIWRQDIETVHFRVDQSNPADPIRHIDCREADADPKAMFDRDFVDSLRPYKAVRFLDWQQANLNVAGDWKKRTLPTSTVQAGAQGVAMEHLVALANQAQVDPWFVMPWKADAAYMEAFATYVRDHLDPARTAYVEIGNEVWNMGFPAGKDALMEGRRANLGKTDDEARMRRYAQHSGEGFVVWERVFAREPKRIVRVLSGQNAWVDLLRYAVDFKDTTAHVDALSTALYFGQQLFDEPPANTADLSPLFPKLIASIEPTMASGKLFKQMADSKGLRYIAYEGGQHLNYHGKDNTLIARINRDPRMGEAFRVYLDRWHRDFGDLLMIFHSVSPTGVSMHFGLAEYAGQPMSETPKRKAVLDAIAATKR